MDLKMAFFGFFVLAVTVLTGIRAECDPMAVLDCTQNYLTYVKEYQRKANEGTAELQEMCDESEKYIQCARRSIVDCSDDAKEQFDQGIENARDKMREAGCDVESGSNFICGSSYLCLFLFAILWILRRE